VACAGLLRNTALKPLIIKEPACKPGSVKGNHSSATAVASDL